MYDKLFTGLIAEEDTLQILFVRNGREKLDDEIQAIFGYSDSMKTEEGEKKISYPVYISKVNKRAMEARKEMKEQKKKQYTKKAGEEDP